MSSRALSRGLVATLCTLVLLAAGSPVVYAQSADASLARVQRLVNAGDRAAASALADSLVARATEGTPAYAEALYARAFASSSAADAERDYLRISIEYPLSMRAEDALMMVAQLRLARGDRVAARRNFERLVRDHPTGPQVAKASFWAGRLALEDGDGAAACPALQRARERVGADDVELRNQVEYYFQRCASLGALPANEAVPTVPRREEPPPGRRDPPREAPARTVPPPAAPEAAEPQRAEPPARPSKEWSVQVAAFPQRRDADALSQVLQQRGFDVRVMEGRPYRVRVGRYESREAAVAAMGRMKAARVNGVVVEAEPR